MYIIIFIIILAVLVFAHELGHFVVAKLSGIRVDEFAIGFPPRLFSFTKGETRYSLNLIPFGGYVKIFGEDYESAESETSSTDSRERSFISKPAYLQVAVLLAGIAFNIIFAWLLISLGFMTGMPVPEGYKGAELQGSVTIMSVVKGSPAEKAGIIAGDKILSLSAPDKTISKPGTADISSYISEHADKQIMVNLGRGTATKSVLVTPEVRQGSDKAIIGITMDSLAVLRLPFFSALWEGAKLTANLVSATAVGLVQFIGKAFIGQAKISEVTGPVGIAGLVNDATRLGFVYLISFTAFISINLALINVIPFPALDGGRVLFVIIEKIKGRPLNQKVVQAINLTGLALLLLLMVVVTYHDIVTLLVK